MKKYLLVALSAASLVAVISIGTVYADKEEKDRDENTVSHADREHPEHVALAAKDENGQDDIERQQQTDLERAENALLRLEAAQLRQDRQDLRETPVSDTTGEIAASFGGVTEEETATLSDEIGEIKDAIESADTPQELQMQADALTALIAPQE